MARLAAFDMDGTLLMPDHRLGERTLSALKRLRERDITLTFATGRHALEMRHVIGEFALDIAQCIQRGWQAAIRQQGPNIVVALQLDVGTLLVLGTKALELVQHQHARHTFTHA